MQQFGAHLFTCCTILFMPLQTLLLSVALVVFGVIATTEIFRSIHQRIRLRRDRASSAPHRGEESTWNELTEVFSSGVMVLVP